MKKVIIQAIFLIVGIIIGVFAVNLFSQKSAYQNNNQYTKSPQNEQAQTNQPIDNQNQRNKNFQSPYCQGTGTIKFTSPPRPLEDIALIEPMGLMIGGHVTPVDHGYYYPPNWVDRATIDNIKDVLAPADGVVMQVQVMPQEYSHSDIGDYRVIIYHTCTFYTIYIHINQLSPKLQAMVNNPDPGKVEVKAGEVIGKANSLDFSAHNDEITLTGFVVPEHYEGEPWKIHTVDPYDYYEEPLKSQLLAKNPRIAVPRGGKIDYDIDGKLIGNWFKENSGGYVGNSPGQYGYWSTHLAIAPDAIDPNHFIISLGDFDGEAKQFGIKANTPDPATIDKTKGKIKYELVSWRYKIGDTNQYWDSQRFAQNLHAENQDAQVKGTVLLQLVNDRKLMVEIFPGKLSEAVSEFTPNAQIYER